MVTYRSRISILNNKLKETPKGYRLIPGMEASAEIKIGARRVIEYLIYPIIRAAGESMREP
jgi:HlyD family secretion protein